MIMQICSSYGNNNHCNNILSIRTFDKRMCENTSDHFVYNSHIGIVELDPND
jgi:hypothetical protein